LRKVKQLFNKHPNKDIYIIGTGPSLRLFPKEFLYDKITIGLNQAYKLIQPTYSLTIHPYLIPLNRRDWNTTWITKTKLNDESWKYHVQNDNDKHFYILNNNNNPRDLSWCTPMGQRPPSGVYVGCGIQTGAIHLAALMGASNAFLIGVDMGLTAGDNHALDQHVEPHQFSLEEMYNEYFYYTYRVAELMKKHFRMNTFNLSIGFGIPHHFEKQYKRALETNVLKQLPESKVIEKNARTTPLVCDFIQ